MEIDQDALLRALLKMAGLLKQQCHQFLELSTDVAALRNTFQEMSGDQFLPLVDRKRMELLERTAGLASSMLQDYDELVRRISEALPGASV